MNFHFWIFRDPIFNSSGFIWVQTLKSNRPIIIPSLSSVAFGWRKNRKFFKFLRSELVGDCNQSCCARASLLLGVYLLSVAASRRVLSLVFFCALEVILWYFALVRIPCLTTIIQKSRLFFQFSWLFLICVNQAQLPYQLVWSPAAFSSCRACARSPAPKNPPDFKRWIRLLSAPNTPF